VFNIDIETCSECGGAVKVIASIEDPVVIKKILTHLKQKIAPAGLELLPQCWAPPQTGWFDQGYGVGPMQSTEFQYYFCTQGLLMILEVLFAASNRGFKDFCNVKN